MKFNIGQRVKLSPEFTSEEWKKVVFTITKRRIEAVDKNSYRIRHNLVDSEIARSHGNNFYINEKDLLSCNILKDLAKWDND